MTTLNRFLHRTSIIWETPALSRSIFTAPLQKAGFQGLKGASMPAQMLQNQLARKKRAVTRLENQALELKPIKDFNIRYSWKVPERLRSNVVLTAEELERRDLLTKEWSVFVLRRKREEDEVLLQLRQSQERALYELRQESEELYQAALEADENLFPITIEGPSETSPIKSYFAPLGGTVKREDAVD